MDNDTLLVTTSDGISTITINRPAAMNAMTPAMIGELGEIVGRLSASPETRVVIITGAGAKAFVAGGDIAIMRTQSALEARETAVLAHRVFAAIEQSPKTFIAAINGYALGGGCELAMSCDIRIASDTARFGQPEINIGILPGFGGSQRLPRLIGKGRALEMILTGDMIDAREACRIGLVNRVVAPDELAQTARELAAKIASKSLAALRLCKEAVVHGLEMPLADACRYEADLFGLCFATSDQKEGMAAFVEKRPPRFTDN